MFIPVLIYYIYYKTDMKIENKKYEIFIIIIIYQ